MDFRAELIQRIDAERCDFDVRGLLGSDEMLYPLGPDTKVLSTVFEILTRPILVELARSNGLSIEEAPQTVYPDFTLLTSKGDRNKIAVDVKTTYRRPKILYTLGSYTSFLRNNTKNILYPYDEYSEHWIVGFVYDRQDAFSTESCSLEKRRQVRPPYRNVDWFVQKKYKISGESPGSGNTANIGSIRTTAVSDFRDGVGPFSKLGEKLFREYWASYGRTAKEREYTNVSEFLEWRRSGLR